MKIKLFLLGLIAPAIASANINNAGTDLDTTNLPQPDSGIKVVPRSQMSYSKAENEKALDNLRQFKSKGYIEEESPYPKKLLKMKYTGLAEIKANQKNNDLYDTHLKANLSSIKLAFPFKGIPMLPDSEIIGYAAPVVGITDGLE